MGPGPGPGLVGPCRIILYRVYGGEDVISCERFVNAFSVTTVAAIMIKKKPQRTVESFCCSFFFRELLAMRERTNNTKENTIVI